MCACTTRSAALPGPALQSATAVLANAVCGVQCIRSYTPLLHLELLVQYGWQALKLTLLTLQTLQHGKCQQVCSRKQAQP